MKKNIKKVSVENASQLISLLYNYLVDIFHVIGYKDNIYILLKDQLIKIEISQK